MDPLKVQTTLRGFPAWALQRYVRKKRVTTSEVVAQMIDEWFRVNVDYLKNEFGISIKDFNASMGPEEEGKSE